MTARTSAATDRALARVREGETPYAAAKAEGIALSTMYRALNKPGGTNYSYAMGMVFADIRERYGDDITATAMGDIAARPDRLPRLLRHLDLESFKLPEKPVNWHPSAYEQCKFWQGYHRYGSGLIK